MQCYLPTPDKKFFTQARPIQHHCGSYLTDAHGPRRCWGGRWYAKVSNPSSSSSTHHKVLQAYKGCIIQKVQYCLFSLYRFWGVYNHLIPLIHALPLQKSFQIWRTHVISKNMYFPKNVLDNTVWCPRDNKYTKCFIPIKWGPFEISVLICIWSWKD